MSKFISSSFSNLSPYIPGEQPQNRKYIKLNTNESPFEPSPKVLDEVNRIRVSELNLYPDPEAKNLISAMAENFNVESENVIVSNGSDEILAFSFLAFCERGVAFADITYGFYKVYAELFGIDTKIIELSDKFEIIPNNYFNLNRTIFIANPNAPTGIFLNLYDIESILQNNTNTLVVIDEAYVDFGGESATKLIQKYDNLLVTGTFSKSRNLAGARIGYAISNSQIIEDLNKIKFSFNPYNLNRLSLVAGEMALKDKEYFEKCTDHIIKTRDNTILKLKELNFEVLPSKANFIFVRCPKICGENYYKALKENGILVRWFSSERIKDFVRITIGTNKQMFELIRITKEIMG